ncbi:glycosyltransferase family 4 protein [Pedobacter sp. ASV28]|uniref:glycosyltransferase family 4 protein n=1 Tax=Pedobacter sp. ASV28 TaxID=2795123 RepID=UPI0018EB491E|nr:glycosyltransferase family 4 protein [Pedobacter sp. ASV28]
MDKKKIAFVLNGINGGGIDRVVTTFANELVRQGKYEVFLILLHKRVHFFKVRPEVKIIENEVLRNGSSKWKYTINTMAFIRKTIKKIKPDRIISNGEWLNSFVYLSAIGLKYPVYFADHSNPERKGQSPYPLLDKWIYPRVKGVLVLSEAAKQKIQRVFGQKNAFIIDNPVFFPVAKPVEKEDVIISMGRLSPEKGQDVLIKAFALTQGNWKLHLLGDGPVRPALEELVKELGIQDRVVFLGLQQDIALHLSKAKIYVMPSHTENFPMALIEAMAIGLPCVATNCMPWRGDDDFITPGENGLKVPVNDHEQLAAGIDQLIQDEPLRSRLAARALEIKTKYNLENIVENLITSLALNSNGSE